MSLTVTKIPYLTRVFGAARGCSMNCTYCSTARWSHRLKCPYCRARHIHFHPERLGDPAAAKKPQVIGVSFYDELFDPERPSTEIPMTLDACDRAPQHQYVFLTKRPLVASCLFPSFREHANWWLGMTVTGNAGDDYERLAYLVSAYEAGCRVWLSLEPWRGPEPVSLRHVIEFCSFVAIGCESGLPADEDHGVYDDGWRRGVADLVKWCLVHHVPVFVKQVFVDGKCNRDPAQWPINLQYHQVPDFWRAILNREERKP